MPPSGLPATVIRLAPIRFCSSADHLRSATVSSEPEIMRTTIISVSRLPRVMPTWKAKGLTVPAGSSRTQIASQLQAQPSPAAAQ